MIYDILNCFLLFLIYKQDFQVLLGTASFQCKLHSRREAKKKNHEASIEMIYEF